jgi:hypothetical protein
LFLVHLLRNRFYVGEVVYRREIHPGEHEANRSLFDAAHAKLAVSANVPFLRLGSKRKHHVALASVD